MADGCEVSYVRTIYNYNMFAVLIGMGMLAGFGVAEVARLPSIVRFRKDTPTLISFKVRNLMDPASCLI